MSVGALLWIILVLGFPLTEILTSGAPALVAVGKEASRTNQLTNMWPEMPHIFSSCNPLPLIGYTARANFKGKEKQILQMPGRKSEILFLVGGGVAHSWAMARAWSGWVEYGASQERKWHGRHLQSVLTLGMWRSKHRSWGRGRDRMGGDGLNIRSGSGNSGISSEDLQPQSFFQRRLHL